jgi:arylsulfatase A-like enzyme
VEARGDGASPYRFRGTTLGDWLRYHNPQARLLSVSRKDRSAILPLGRAKGSAFWYALEGAFTTSTYYADTLPTWIKRFNARRLPQRQAGQVWSLLLDAAAYPEPDSVSYEGTGGDFTFPHVVPADTARATRVLQNFPMMDDITLQLALEGLQANGLGSVAGRTDLLSISLSTTDAIGHRYGPDSREVHDQILRLDRYLGAFLDSLYRLRDSSRIVIALTSDHGVGPSPNPAVATRYRQGAAGTADIRPVAAAVRRSLIAAGVDSSAFRYDGEVLFLEPEPFERARVNRDSVARVYARLVSRVEGVLRADVWDDLRKRDPRRDTYVRRWQHMIAPDMPVAVLVTLKPHWFWAEGTNFGRHGTPHDYDAHVPLLFAGAGIRPGRHNEFVRVVDIAPTLAAVAGVRPMEALDGVVLLKALR